VQKTNNCYKTTLSMMIFAVILCNYSVSVKAALEESF
jgi:hypothetical protein